MWCFRMSEVPSAPRRASDEIRNLHEDTTSLEVYCHRQHKGEWMKEAEEHGCSLSQYVSDLTQEARWHRQYGDVLVKVEY